MDLPYLPTYEIKLSIKGGRVITNKKSEIIDYKQVNILIAINIRT